MKVTPEVKECIVKMAQAFEKDKIRGYPEFTNIKYRIASILGIGRSTVFRTLDDNRHYEGPVKDVVSSIHKDKVLKKKKQQSKLCKLDDFDISVIRRSIHAMSKSGKFISLRTLAKELESKDIKISPVTLKKYMNRNGFVFHKKHGKRFLHESGDIVAHRHSYLRQIRKFREEGLEVVYLDETWVNSNHACAGEWSENRKGPCSMLLPNCKECSRHIPSGKGSRLIVLDAGSSTTGFIPDVSLIFTSKTKSSDYHDEMNGQHFLEWFEYTLLPALPAPSVVVMDNAPYHNIKTDDSWYPKRSSNKTTIVQWLLNKNIQADESELKVNISYLT